MEVEMSELIQSRIDNGDLKGALESLQAAASECEYPYEVASEIAQAFRGLANDDSTTQEFVTGAVDLLLHANVEYGETSAEAWVNDYFPALDVVQHSQTYDLRPYYEALLKQVCTLSYCEEEWAGKKILERAEEVLGHEHEATKAVREWESQNEYF